MNAPRTYDPVHWHRRAEELRTIATEREGNPDACSLLRQLADEYDLLAKRADDRLQKGASS
jgi:hypothetical protein